MAEAIVIFLQIIFGLLVIFAVGLLYFTIYQFKNPNKFKNKGWLHRKNKDLTE